MKTALIFLLIFSVGASFGAVIMSLFCVNSRTEYVVTDSISNDTNKKR